MTQKFSLYEDLSIRENLDFVGRMYRVDRRKERVERALLDLGLADRAKQLAGTLSGGWKQRLALAACLMHDPKLLLLDEPTAGVDPKARRDFWDEIRRLAAHGRHGAGLDPLHGRGGAVRFHRVHRLRQEADRRAVGRDHEAGRAHDLAGRGARPAGDGSAAERRRPASCRSRGSARRCMSRGPMRAALGRRWRRLRPRARIACPSSRAGSKRRSSTSWRERGTISPATQHELFALTLCGDLDQRVHPDAARPHHVRDDDRAADHPAPALRLHHQLRRAAPADADRDERLRPAEPRHRLGHAGVGLLRHPGIGAGRR